MRPFLLLCLAVSLSAHAQAVAPMPAPVPVRPPPVMTPGYFPGSQGNPVYTPTGAGLPGERVPGTVAPPVPRSKGRILPREPDGAPGLWAADGARASSTEVSLFDVDVPLPVGAEASVATVAGRCALDMDVAMRRSVQLPVLNYRKADRFCMAARSLLYCVLAEQKDHEGTTDWSEAAAHRTLERHLNALLSERCKASPPDEHKDALKAIVGKWEWITRTRQ